MFFLLSDVLGGGGGGGGGGREPWRYNWGEPERAPHSRALQDVRPSVCPVGVRPTSGVHLVYDRISKCNVALPARVLRATRVQVAHTTVPSIIEPATLYSLRHCYKLRSYYRLAEVSWRERFSRQLGVLLSGTV